MHSLAMVFGRRALVLKKFQINPEGGEYVHIVARKAGLLAWLLTIFGIDSTTEFRVYSNRIEFQRWSLSGKLQTVLPLRAVSIATCGYMKPVLLLVLAILALLAFWWGFIGTVLDGNLAAVSGMILALILFAVFIIYYFLNKNLLISIVSSSSWPIEICFKRSVIEGVKIEYAQAQQVIDIIKQLLIAEASK